MNMSLVLLGLFSSLLGSEACIGTIRSIVNIQEEFDGIGIPIKFAGFYHCTSSTSTGIGTAGTIHTDLTMEYCISNQQCLVDTDTVIISFWHLP